MTEIKEKFTKGDWELDRFGTIKANGETLLVSGVAIPCGYSSNEEVEANTHLITAAPEMYNMLNLALSYMDGDSIEDFAYQYKEIEKLLAKARGENNE